MQLVPPSAFVEQPRTSPLLRYVPRSSFAVTSQAPPVVNVMYYVSDMSPTGVSKTTWSLVG